MNDLKRMLIVAGSADGDVLRDGNLFPSFGVDGGSAIQLEGPASASSGSPDRRIARCPENSQSRVADHTDRHRSLEEALKIRVAPPRARLPKAGNRQIPHFCILCPHVIQFSNLT
jgi:hypothetical protein